MVFSSEIFLFAFLPAVLALYFLVRGAAARNVVLVVASLFFYAWGEGRFVLLVLGSALVNYGLGLALDQLPGGGTRERRLVVGAGVALNLAILIVFKYAGFFGDNLNFIFGNTIGRQVTLSQIYLPLGISFFSFHAISYIVDVYRRTSGARKNPLEVVLYFVFFPQLIAGPIIRYKDVASQLGGRTVAISDFAYGARRFVVGLSKKVLIANTLGASVDHVFAAQPGTLSLPVAWFALAAYTLQIYFDFSGYSDMAIGLARMFGFRFLENFDFPYIATSIQEFWRRWHISLSRWFRDYLYIPLGGNRVSPWRVYANLVIVFFLCGLWHGAKWTFVVWGLLHGLFLVLERVGAVRRITATPVLRHVYVMAVVMFAWVFFRSDTFGYALGFLTALVRPNGAPMLVLANVVDHETVLAFLAGCVLATPVLANRFDPARAPEPPLRRFALSAVPAVLAGLFVVSVAKLAAGTYNPFIYFRF
ncbi:MAG: alginate O-acetyltransferase complex protein AlgI [Candidatus Eremiobacteraeota bacterium]|jgi:alginate O-acetyltransferase complex protein AlgI|nr:alginate O-acetyltransferase complex protein AlgI [Candidatus Eremiobacteraeota bacterium]MEA2718871.1 alginate O-acetyltransferase complex protein AlgI [Candidatus Eremiobacteraeota bacterium]